MASIAELDKYRARREGAESSGPDKASARSPRVNSWKWNELEEDVLDELPHAAQIIYLRIMRKHMDYKTGIVGRVRRISYEQIKERLRYTPPPQSHDKPVEYSTDQVKKLIQKLVKAGLLERLHDTTKGVQPMEFRLPLASTDDESHERATATRPRENPRGSASGEDVRATREPRKNADEGHPSGSGNPSSPYGEDVAALAPKKPKARSRKWGEDIDHALVSEMHAAVSRDLTNPKKPNANAWANDFRLMRTCDERTVEQIRYLITWTAQHHFWSGVILSPAKLRAKWDQLEIQVKKLKESRHENRHSASQPRAERDRVAASLADPYDTSWADGLFDEGGAEGADQPAGEPCVYPHGGNFPSDMADVVHHGRDAEAGEAGARVFDGELVFAADSGASRHGD